MEKITSCEVDLSKIHEEKIHLTATKAKTQEKNESTPSNFCSSPSFQAPFDEKSAILSKNNELNKKIQEISWLVEEQKTEIKEKGEKISILEANLSELSEKNQNLINEIEKKQGEINTLELEFEKSEKNSKKVSDKSDIMNSLKQERNDFKKQNMIILEEYNKLQKEFQILSDRQANLQNDLLSKKQKIKILENENIEYKNNDYLQNKLKNEELIKENHSLNEKIRKLHDEKLSLLSENEKVYQLLQTFDLNKDKYKEMKETICQHQNNENFLLLKQKENSETLKKKDEIIRKYEENFRLAKEELENTRKELEINQNLIRQLTKLKDNYIKDQEKIRELQNQVNNYKQKETIIYEKKELENQQIFHNMQDYQLQIKHLKQENENLTNKINESYKTNNFISEQQFQEKFASLNRKKDDEVTKNSDLLKIIEAFKQENQNLIQEIELKEKKINELQNKNINNYNFNEEHQEKLKKKNNFNQNTIKENNEAKFYEEQIKDLKEIIEEKEHSLKKLAVFL